MDDELGLARLRSVLGTQPDMPASPQPGALDIDALLGSLGLDPGVLLDVSEEEHQRGLRAEREAAAQIEKVRRYDARIAEIQADQVRTRQRLEQQLAQSIEKGWIATREAAEARRVEIEKQVAKGMDCDWVFNNSSDPKYYRTQTYWATIDGQGNIWGDFEPATNTYNVSGVPHATGRHLVFRNPHLPKTNVRG